MSVIRLIKDRQHATFTVLVALDGTLEQVWDLFADPRKMEKWWGPPTWPATFTDYTLEAGGETTYTMTGPEGDTSGGWMEFTTVQKPALLELRDGFSNDDGSRSTDFEPMNLRITFDQEGGAVQIEVTTFFGDLEYMDKMFAMGLEEGLAGAVGQMDGLLK